MRTTLMALALMGCADPATGDSAASAGPAVDACAAHAQVGNLVTANAAPDSGAALALSATPYEVQLIEGAAGYLRLVVDTDTSALMFAGTAGVVSGLLDPDGDDVLPGAAPDEHCPDDIPEQRSLLLTSGTWNLVVGPSAETSLWLVLVEVD